MLFFALYVLLAATLVHLQAKRMQTFYNTPITPTLKVYLTYLITLPILLPYFAKQILPFLWYKG